MIIWGFRSKSLQLAMLTFLCGRCNNPAAHPLVKVVRKFTLFFIPLFPVSTKHYTQCTFCGVTVQLTKEQAEQALASVQPAAPAPVQTPAPEPSVGPKPTYDPTV